MDAETALHGLQSTAQLQKLSLHTLSEPYLPSGRSQGVNTESTRSPAILAADLEHYKSLFSKLRFSYVEQVTKERFLRAITSAEPEFVSGAENAELEERLKEDKAGLKERKTDVGEIVEALGEQGRGLGGRYEEVQRQTAQLERLPSDISALESRIAVLRSTSHATNSSNPSLALPLQPTLSLLSDSERTLADLDRHIRLLQTSLPEKQVQVSGLKDEVSVMNARKIKAVEEAQEARRRREDGMRGDEIDERGRWLRGVEAGLSAMLQVDGPSH